MVSLCFKSVNKNTLDILERYIERTRISSIYYSQKKFKKFYNLIIHYVGHDHNIFFDKLSEIWSNYIINTHEKKYINQQLNYDFFYFSDQERKSISMKINEHLNQKSYSSKKMVLLKTNIKDFIKTHKSFNVDGFINFRLYDYKSFLKDVLESEVHTFVVEKEYSEYVSVLREYLQTQPAQVDTIHLLYGENEKLLLDNFGNIITTTESKKYLSDISFSTNDFILNSIISLIPKKLIIHLSDNEDNFIVFLTQIFEGRYTICKQCDICYPYKYNNSHK